MLPSEPLLSVVVTSRNDDHGATLLRRMQTFTNCFIGQCRRHGLAAELIIVEWNPPADRPKLAEALRWPADCGPCVVRIIEVPNELHLRLKHAEALPLFQMIAKNVGIRRARGQFVLATNIDILLSDEMMRAIVDGQLRDDRMYRVDRMDVMTRVPVDASVEEQLAYCRSHFLRRNAREGTFRLNPDGSFYADPADVFPPEGNLVPGPGFFALEQTEDDEPLRWVGPGATLHIEGTAPRLLALEVSPGPGIGFQPFHLDVFDAAGQRLGRARVERRQRVYVSLPPASASPLRLSVPQEGRPLGLDPRNLVYSLYRCSGATEVPAACIDHPENVRAAVMDADVLSKKDVAGPDDGIRFAGGFYGPEWCHGERMRWVGPEATLVIRVPDGVTLPLCLELQDGPALGEAPLDLEVYDEAGTSLASACFRGRTRLRLSLPAAPALRRLTLRVRGELVPVASDPRKLCYRLLRAGWSVEPAPGTRRIGSPAPRDCTLEVAGDLESRDVAAADQGVRFGEGFYQVETFRGAPFRWASDRAALVVTTPAGETRSLALTLEPGPRASYEAIDLHLRDHTGTLLARGAIGGRQRVYLPLPSTQGKPRVFYLEAQPRVVGDPSSPRQMTFRVHSCAWAARSAALPAPAGIDFAVEWAEPPAPWDAASKAVDLRFGGGWYPLERADGDVFRWGRDGAVLEIAAPAPSHLNLLLEPAQPDETRTPVHVRMCDAQGEVVAEARVAGREVVRLPLPRGTAARTVSLHTAGGPVRRPNDDRALSFRVILPTAAALRRSGGFLNRLRRLWARFHAPAASDTVETGSVDDTTPTTSMPAASSVDVPREPPYFLHCNACGDFTLLARDQWFAVRAYPELEIFSLHIDTLFCHIAHCAGVREEVLPDPIQVYHIEHSEGSGWTPEGADKLMKKVTAKGIPVLDANQVFLWGAQLRQGETLAFNAETWGLADADLPETILGGSAGRAAA